jgi:hypothetical protein
VTRKTIHEYVEALRPRYLAASRPGKQTILAEFCATTRYHRKSAIRLFKQPAIQPQGRRGRRRIYGLELREPLRILWEAADCICAKRLAPFLPELLASLEAHSEIRLDGSTRQLLLQMSASTMDRLLATLRLHKRKRHGLTQSQSQNAIRNQVPVRTFGSWAGEAPGAMQADLVFHCGNSTQGFHLCSLLAVDVKTSWIGLQVTWGKGQSRVRGAVEKIKRDLPFALRSLHTDNGGEFLNGVLFPWCQSHGVTLSRGRPYRKNDQAYAEQRNWQVVRCQVGYDRYSTQQAYKVMERLYRRVVWYFNFFQPVSKIVSTERAGAKVTRKYDQAQTPYQRLVASKVLDETQRGNLERLYRSLNPVTLRQDIRTLHRELWEFRQPWVQAPAQAKEGPAEDQPAADRQVEEEVGARLAALAD